MKIDSVFSEYKRKVWGLVLVFLFSAFISNACQCPLTTLSLQECDKYEIIFRGKILSVKDCGSKFGEALFEVEELYKGNATKEFTVLFECQGPCYQQFQPGQEWVIYSRYKQINNAMMDWCSRSRKYFKNEKEDFYSSTYGNDYYDEVKFLQDNLGAHRVLSGEKKQTGERNQLPDTSLTIIILICSVGGIVLFYFLFNRFFR